MKRVNKILTTSILATALLGAGAIKVSNDSVEIAAFNAGETRADADSLYDDGWYAQKAYEGAPEAMVQEKKESKAASSEWTEYTTGDINYVENGYTTENPNVTLKMSEPAYLAMNYSLVTEPEDVTIGDYTTRQYYEVGGVFRLQNHPNSATNAAAFKHFVNGMAVNGVLYGDKSAQKYSWDQYNELQMVHKWYDVEDYTAQDLRESGFTWFKDVSDPVPLTQDLEHRGVYLNFQELITRPSYEDWHKSFDNDETTLFGATSYNPNAHFILRVPILDNPLDNDLTDSFGVTPSKEKSSENWTSAYGDAVSNKDILAISEIQLRAKTDISTGGTNDDVYGVRFGQSAMYLDKNHAGADWDTKMEHAMELAYPEPEFTITPLGYNERNQFEVDVIYDHKSIPTNYDIVSEITYTMMGPATKESDAEDEKVIWDEITITDQKVTREHRANIDSPETVTDTIWTYGQPVPDELSQWIDNDKDNGGNVDLDENPIPGAEAMFPDGYDGDMEIGATESAHSVIKYDGLYYGDDLEDLGKEYTFSNTITLAPTDLGRDNAYLLAVPDGGSVTKEYGPWSYIIEPGSASPVIEHFEITKPESLDEVDPLGSMTISYKGDSKSYDEDTGVGLKPTYLNSLQVIAMETDVDGNVTGEEEIALTDPFKPTNIDEATGAFNGEINTKENSLTANTHFKIYLRAFYGNEDTTVDPLTDLTTLHVDYDEAGEFIVIDTTDLGDLAVVLDSNTVVYNEDGTATLTFNYSEAIPEGVTGELNEFTHPAIAKVEVVNHLGEANETVIDTLDAAEFAEVELTDTPQEAVITVGSDKLLPNRTHDLSVRVTTVGGRTHTSTDVNTDVDFTTPATGPFVPEVGMLAPINTEDVVGGVTTDFEFTLKQQTGTGIDLVETSESLITNISLKLTDVDGKVLIDQPSIAIPAEDSSTITITDGENIYNTVDEYDYSIEVTYAGAEPVLKEGKVSFELSGFSELEEQDVVMTDASSTMTSFYFETEINDVEIAPGYDSYYVNKVEVVDADNKAVDADIKWYDPEGNIIDAPVDTDEGIEFSGKFSAQLTNIAAGTDLSTYKLHVNTNSINEAEDDPTHFETDYYKELFVLAEEGGLTDATGNFLNSPDMSKEFMDVEPVAISDFNSEDVIVTEDSATFTVSLDDKMDVINKEEIILIDNSGKEYSYENGNLSATHIMSREAGMKTFEFVLTGLSDNTEYSNWKMSYVISENLGTEEEPLVSSTTYVVDMTDVTFKTLEKENGFPWWIIIVILLIISIVGIVLLLLWLLLFRSVRVVATKETSAGTSTFVVNRDEDSKFLEQINGRTLNGSQNGAVAPIAYTAALTPAGEVEIKLTGLKSNNAPVKGLVFLADGKEGSKDIKVMGSVDTEVLTKAEALKTEAQANQAIKIAKREIGTQKSIIKQSNKIIKTTDVEAKKVKAESAKKAAETKLAQANEDLNKAKETLKEIKSQATATARKF